MGSQNFKTEQEEFWAGEFGDTYIDRNRKSGSIARNIALFSKIFTHVNAVKSIIEFGANIGLNLQSINHLLPQAELSAVEINKKAVEELKIIQRLNVYSQSILDFMPDYPRDFVFTKGVLIHINPDNLEQVYEILYKTSKRYICVIEYYNPYPVEVLYRGYENKLFKRDFAGEILNRFKDLHLVSYGFVYHLDNLFFQDDLTWFLLEKGK